MLRIHQVSQAIFGSVSTRHGDLKGRNYTGVFYIGLGDQFDDDRRLVREAPPGNTSHLGGAAREARHGSHGLT
jgi:hypothetical protein